VHELGVDADAIDDGIPIVEFAIQLAERCDFRRTHEREVLRPKENDFPLACIAVLIERLERIRDVVRHDARQRKLRKFLSNTQHYAYLDCSDAFVGQTLVSKNGPELMAGAHAPPALECMMRVAVHFH
jgi:hypothetical protein